VIRNFQKPEEKKIFKVSYVAPSVTRQLYLMQDTDLYDGQVLSVTSRGSAIPFAFEPRRVKIYTGRGYTIREMSVWMIGFKFGEFTWNRKLALYKAKQLRKKAKKKAK
jgi:ribosomal protein S19